MMHPSDQGGRPRGASGGKGSGERRKRTHFSPAEVAILVEAFAKDPYPGFEEREKLAERIDKPEGRVQVWFQNRRARHQHWSHPRKPRNQGVPGPSFYHEDQPGQKPKDAPPAAGAPAAQSFAHQPNQPGTSWHSAPPVAQEERNGRLPQPHNLADMGQPEPFSGPSFAQGSGWSQAGMGVAENFLVQQLQGQGNPYFQQAPAYNGYADEYLQQPWQPNVQHPAYGVPQQGIQHCPSWHNTGNSK